MNSQQFQMIFNATKTLSIQMKIPFGYIMISHHKTQPIITSNVLTISSHTNIFKILLYPCLNANLCAIYRINRIDINIRQTIRNILDATGLNYRDKLIKPTHIKGHMILITGLRFQLD